MQFYKKISNRKVKVKIMMKTMITRFLAVPVASAMMLVTLCGCAPADTADAAPAASQSVSVSSLSVETAAPSSTPAASGNTVRDRFRHAKEQAGSSDSSGNPSSTPTAKPEASQAGPVYDVILVITIPLSTMTRWCPNMLLISAAPMPIGGLTTAADAGTASTISIPGASRPI